MSNSEECYLRKLQSDASIWRKRGKMIILVTGYEQSSTWTKTQGISNDFPNAFLTSCPVLETILTQTQVWKEKLVPKFQFNPEILAKPTEDYCITSSIWGSWKPLFCCSYQDILQKTEALRPQGRGIPGYDIRPFMEYIFLMIWLSISWNMSLLHSVISWGCCVQMYRNFMWDDLDSQFLSSNLLAVYPGCRQLSCWIMVERWTPKYLHAERED